MNSLRGGRTGKVWCIGVLLLVACLGLLAGIAHVAAGYVMSRSVLTTGPNGAAMPAGLGLAFERVAMPSGGRKLDGYVVRAAPTCHEAPVLLIYHGSQETISEWVNAQRFLYRHCVSSVVFDPSGSGDSSRPASIERIDEGAVAAYRLTVARFPHSRVYVLGHSLGNGVMLQMIPAFATAPSGVIVADTYSSMRHRSAIQKHWLYRALVSVMPDWWNNVQAVKRVHTPLLVIHSEADQVNPVGEGRAVYAAANEPKSLVILQGFAHNALYQAPTEGWWAPVLSFVHAPGGGGW